MPKYDNTNTGLIFKKVPKTPKHPILSGFLDVEGTEYSVAIWPMLDEEGKARRNKAGEAMFSVKLTAKDDSEVPI